MASVWLLRGSGCTGWWCPCRPAPSANRDRDCKDGWEEASRPKQAIDAPTCGTLATVAKTTELVLQQQPTPVLTWIGTMPALRAMSMPVSPPAAPAMQAVSGLHGARAYDGGWQDAAGLRATSGEPTSQVEMHNTIYCTSPVKEMALTRG